MVTVLLKRPLVHAQRQAIEQASSVLPGVVLENAVTEAINAGRCVRVRRDSDRLYVYGRDWRARCVRTRSRMNPERKAWLITEIANHNQTEER